MLLSLLHRSRCSTQLQRVNERHFSGSTIHLFTEYRSWCVTYCRRCSRTCHAGSYYQPCAWQRYTSLDRASAKSQGVLAWVSTTKQARPTSSALYIPCHSPPRPCTCLRFQTATNPLRCKLLLCKALYKAHDAFCRWPPEV